MTPLASPRAQPLSMLLAVLLLSACASGPIATEPASCAELQAELHRAEAEQRAAAQQRDDAWKAVLPVAVAARYASSRSAGAEADRRLAALRAASAQRQCGHG